MQNVRNFPLGGGGSGPAGPPGPPGASTSMGNIQGPNSQGATIVSNVLRLSVADSANPGMISISPQTLGSGTKAIQGDIICHAVDLPTSDNTGLGSITINSNSFMHSVGTETTFLGENAGNFANITGIRNTGEGYHAGYVLTSGHDNCLLGANAGYTLTTGSNHILLGSNAGGSMVGTENGNIYISETGVANESQAIRIGNTQQTCYIAGIGGVNQGGTISIVTINTSGQLGTTNFAGISLGPIGSTPNANGATLVANVLTLEPASASFGGLVTTAAQTFAGTKTFPAVNIQTAGSIQWNGVPLIESLNTTGGSLQVGHFSNATLAANNTAIGNNSLSSGTPGTGNTCLGAQALQVATGTENIAIGYQSLVGLGAGSDNIAIGNFAGEGILTGASNVIIGNGSGTNYTGAESGNFLVNSPGVLGESDATHINDGATSCTIGGIYGQTPAMGYQYVIQDSTGLLGSTTSAVGLSVGAPNVTSDPNALDITGSVLTAHYADGTNPGLLSAVAQNIAGDKSFLGNILLPTTTSSTGIIKVNGNRFIHALGTNANSFLGTNAGNLTNTGSSCVGIGASALLALTSGAQNVCCGPSAGVLITSGNQNICLGNGSGSALTTESNNICVGNIGIAATSNSITLGNGSHTSCYIAGAYGVSPASPQMMVVASNGQLGSAAIPGGIGSIGAFSGSSTANVLTLAAGVLTAHAADATNPGCVSTTTQGFSGAKTFNQDITAVSNINMPRTTPGTTTAGVLMVNASRFLHTSGASGTATNIFLGTDSGNLTIGNTTANSVGIGQGAMLACSSCAQMTCIGDTAGSSYVSASGCIAIGSNAGTNASASGLDNIHIGTPGVGGDSQVTRVGIPSVQTKAFVAGIDGNTPLQANLPQFMLCDPTSDQMCSSTACAWLDFTTGGRASIGSGGVVTAGTVRGVAATITAGQIVIPSTTIRVCKIGKMCYVFLPQIQVTTFTGGIGNIQLIFNSFSPALPVPNQTNISNAVAINNGIYDAAAVAVLVSGVSITIQYSAVCTAPFGLPGNSCIIYTSAT